MADPKLACALFIPRVSLAVCLLPGHHTLRAVARAGS